MPSSRHLKSIDQVVADVNRYPLEAFDFLREGLSHAVQRVHGTPGRDEQIAQQWMARNDVDLEQLERLYTASELPNDIQKLVDKLGGPGALNRHVSGQELCLALRELAVERWGLLAGVVLRHWQVQATEDFGRIVFALVDGGHLQKRPEDGMDDFKKVYDFRAAFDGYQIHLTQGDQPKDTAKESR